MSLRISIGAVVAFVAIAWTALAIAEQTEPKPSTDNTQSREAEEKKEEGARKSRQPIFMPRNTGAPLTRVGGATRGASIEKRPEISALVPEELAFTIADQPRLYWYLSDSTALRVDFNWVDSNAPGETFERSLEGPFEAGMQRIDLAALGLRLEPGARYLWTVKLVPDPERRSQDRVSGGAIERLDTPPELAAELAQADASGQAAVLAAAGIWYDALDDLTTRIASGGATREQRAVLLDQVGLGGVAARERAI